MGAKVLAMMMVLLPLLVVAEKREMSKSDLFVAKCRSHCVKQLTVDSAEETCLVQEECLRCWASCKAFQSDHYIRDYCKRNKICTSGCRQACSFYMASGQDAPSSSGSAQVARDSDRVRPDPVVVSLDLTSETSENAPVYSLVNGRQAIWSKDVMRMGDRNASTTDTNQERWTLLLQEMLFREPLVSATVSWESRGQGSQYLVTWELMSGGLRGHLVSADTSAALPLWPDEDYVVQVFTGTSASEPLQVSTRRPVPAPEEAAAPASAAPVRLVAVLFLLVVTIATIGALAVYRHRRRRAGSADNAALLSGVDGDEVTSSDSAGVEESRRSLLSRSVQNLPPHVLADPRTAPVFVVPCHKR